MAGKPQAIWVLHQADELKRFLIILAKASKMKKRVEQPGAAFDAGTCNRQFCMMVDAEHGKDRRKSLQ